MLRERNSSRFERRGPEREHKNLDFQLILGKMLPWGVGIGVLLYLLQRYLFN